MTCTDCDQAARTWNWHGYRNGCPDCQIRVLAQSPRAIREIRYSQLERQLGAEPTAEIQRRVKAEHQRINAMKGAQ